MANSPNENLRAVYEQTSEMFGLLADLRFRLLAFVPTLCAAAIALLTSSTAPKLKTTVVALGLLGFVVTLGILIYELRNTQLYEQAYQDATSLRNELLKGSNAPLKARPGRQKLFNAFWVWHDRALALVYGTALGGWSYIVFVSLLPLGGGPTGEETAAATGRVSLALAVLVALAFFWQIEDLDLARTKEWQLPSQASKRSSYNRFQDVALLTWGVLFISVLLSSRGKLVSASSTLVTWLGGWTILAVCIVLLLVLGVAMLRLRASIRGEGLKRKIDFSLCGYPHAREVSVAGTFNSWDPAANPLDCKHRVWVGDVATKPGRHAYKFIVDGEWIRDPDNEQSEGEGVYTNSVRVVE